MVIAAGATAFRHVVPAESVAAVIEAYAVGVDRTVYFVTGMAAVAFFVAWPLGFGKIQKKEKGAETAEGEVGVKGEV